MVFEVVLIRTDKREERARVYVQAPDKNTLEHYIMKEGLDEISDEADNRGLWNQVAAQDPSDRFEYIEETTKEPHLSIKFLVERKI